MTRCSIPPSIRSWVGRGFSSPGPCSSRGKVNHLHPIKIKGEKFGEMELAGSFKTRSASGTLRYQDPACYGTIAWKAKLKK